MNELRSGWKAAAVGYTIGLVAGSFVGILPDSSFFNLLSLFGAVYYLYGLWRVSKASQRQEIFTLNLWATLIQLMSIILLGVALGLSGAEGSGFRLSAGILLAGLLVYAGLVYASYLEMRGLTALAEVGGVPLIGRGARWIFVGALLFPVLVGLLVALVGYLMVAVGLWQGPKAESNA